MRISFGGLKRVTANGGKISAMKIATGTVVDGKVVVEGETLAEGSTVTVLLREDEEAFELTPEEEEELLESIAEIERGEFISGDQLLERLRRFGRPLRSRSRSLRGPPLRSRRLRDGGRTIDLLHPARSVTMWPKFWLYCVFNLEPVLLRVVVVCVGCVAQSCRGFGTTSTIACREALWKC